MKSKDLAKRLLDLGYEGDSGPYGSVRRDDHAAAEVRLHEFAHAATLGWVECDSIATLINKMSNRAADWNELKTVAVEYLVAKKCGLCVSLGVLADYAAEGMKIYRNSDAVFKITKKLIKAQSIAALADAAYAKIMETV